MSEYSKILIAKENASDNYFLLTQLLIKSGEYVQKDQIIATIESSKASIDIEANKVGYVYFNPRYLIGQQIPVGALLALISDKQQPCDSLFEAGDSSNENVKSSGRFSRKALQLIEANAIDESVFSSYKLIRQVDVEQYLANHMREVSSSECIQIPTIGPDDVVILGGGGHARMCIDLLRQQNKFSIVGIIDASLPLGAEVLGVKVIGRDTSATLSLLAKAGLRYVVNGVGAVTQPFIRAQVYQRIKNCGLYVMSIVHPSSTVEPSATIGEGVQVMMGARIGSGVFVGANSVVNSGAIISHDSIIGEHCHIAPGAILAGGVRVGKGSLIGMGVTIYLGVSVGENVVVPNGEHLFADLNKTIKRSTLV